MTPATAWNQTLDGERSADRAVSSLPLVIIGAGGFAREVVDLLDAAAAEGRRTNFLGYIVEPEFGSPGDPVLDKTILGSFDWLGKNARDVAAICAVGDPGLRRRLTAAAARLGVRFATLVHPRATLSRWVRLGEGSIVTANCIVNNGVRIGQHAHVNLSCTIGHDAQIGDLVTLSPGVHVSGNVTIEEEVFVGTGAVMIERRRIGQGAIVGAGAVIVRDVPAGTTVVGNPARPLPAKAGGTR